MPTPREKAEQEKAEREAVLAHTVEVARHGFSPKGPVTDGRSSGPAAEGVFSARDLLVPPYEAVRYTMPGGKHLWVHATSLEEVAWLNGKALEETKVLVIQDADRRQFEMRLRAETYQVIACCRQGPELNSPKVFGIADAELLRRNPGWYEAIREICGISDQLATGRAEEVEAHAAFFDAVRSWAATWSSRLSTDSPEASEALSRFARCAVSIKERGKPAASDAAVVAALLPE